MPHIDSPKTTTPDQEHKSPTHPRFGLSNVIDETLLKGHWRRIKKDLRHLRPANLYLAYDPLEWLTFDANLGKRIHELGTKVLDGSYRANPPEIIRGAKSLGLTRPLAFFSINDLLIYRNIIALMETDLLREMQPWSRLGRIHSQQDDQNFAAESGWFRAWLRRNSQLWTITERYRWIVETDISNFFPSIHLNTVIDHLLTHSEIGVDVSRVLSHMLREFAPLPEYRVSPIVGLPQDSFDCSRVIAHSFLGQVDEEFLEEGKNNSFSRYMDNIVIGATSREEGHKLVNRTQQSLERLGLYPNTAKTRVIKQSEFIDDMMKDENDYIGDVEDTLKNGGLVSLDEIRSRLNQHLRLTPKPHGWERVLRRYYTLSRRLRLPRLLDVAFEQIGQYPGSTRSILDYCATYPLTPRRLERLRTTVETTCSMYEDIQQLAFEYLAIAPNLKNQRLSSTICSWMTDVLQQEHDRNGRLYTTACILLAKFGGDAELDFLQQLLENGTNDPATMRVQLLVILTAASRLSLAEVIWYSGESRPMADAAHFITGLFHGDKKYFWMALSVIKPRERREPRIYMIPPRGMFLCPIAERGKPESVYAARDRWRNILRTNAVGLSDEAGKKWLGI